MDTRYFGDVMGVMFGDKHSFRDYGMWLRERPQVGDPEPKIEYLEIPGADGALDVTEAVAGEVKYGQRQMLFRFSAMADIAEQQNIRMRLRNDLHGKRMHIILDEDSDYYYDGRLNVEFVDEMPWKFGVDISVIADPFKYEHEKTSLHCEVPIFSSIAISPVENTARQSWNSQFLFGTPNVPTGDFRAFNRILIEWSAESKRQANPFWQVVDGDGHVANLEVPVQTDVYWADVTTSALTNAGIDVSKIYRILVSGIGDCQLILMAEYGAELYVENGAKSVVPEWHTNYTGLYAWVNGITAEIPTGYSKNPHLVLTAGENHVIIASMTSPSGSRSIDMEFRRGWL